MHHLASLLQHQLSTDSSAFAHLPTIISSLDSSQLQPSPNVSKWVCRINSLLHSKEPVSVWTGLCLARATAELNNKLLVEHAQTWITTAIPLLSKTEYPPVIIMATRLLLYTFSSTTTTPEFQRHVCIPNAQRTAQALLSLVENAKDTDLQALATDAVKEITRLYPNLAKPLQPSLLKLSLSHLSGALVGPSPSNQTYIFAELLATLHLTAGKVGGSIAWRKTLDGAVGEASRALQVVRATYGQEISVPQDSLGLSSYPADPMIAIPLALDRLKCMVVLIRCLLRTVVTRPVLVPLGSLVSLVQALWQGKPDLDMVDSRPHPYFDPSQRALELSLIPDCIVLGCDLVSSMAICAHHHLSPHSTSLVPLLTHHLASAETTPATRIALLGCIKPLVLRTHGCHSTPLLSRLAKALLPPLVRLLAEAPSPQSGQAEDATLLAKRKANKRSRGYDGDEVFNSGKVVASSLSSVESEEVIAVLEALLHLTRTGFLTSVIVSLVHRLMLSLLLALPHRTDLSICSDQTARRKILSSASVLCVELTTTTPGNWTSKSLGTVVSILDSMQGSADPEVHSVNSHLVEGILHSQLPPILRSLPLMGSLALFRAEETQQEREIRDEVRILTSDEIPQRPGLEEGAVQIRQSLPTAPQAQTNHYPGKRNAMVTQSQSALPGALIGATLTPPISGTQDARHAVPSPRLPLHTPEIAPAPEAIMLAHSTSHLSSPSSPAALASQTMNQAPSSSEVYAGLAKQTSVTGSSQFIQAGSLKADTQAREPLGDSDDEEMPTINIDSDTDED